MSEQMEVVGTESTTSMAATEGTETGAAASAQVETTVATDENVNGEGTTPPQAETEGATQQTAGTDDNAVTIPVQFNHEIREVPLEEAQPYIQKGMKLDALAPTLDKLRLIAAANGRTLEETAEDIYGAFERQHREAILQQVGGNEAAADALMEKKRGEWQAGFEAAKSTAAKAEEDSRQALAERLASEFAEVAKDFPEMQQFADVPQEVVNDAVKNKRNLYDAFLRYRQRESVKATQNQQAQQRAAAASTGSQTAGATAVEMGSFTMAALEGLKRGLR